MANADDLFCPVCEGPMRLKTNRATGSQFYSCSSYPTCKGTRDEKGRAAFDRDAIREVEVRSGKTNRRYEGFGR